MIEMNAMLMQNAATTEDLQTMKQSEVTSFRDHANAMMEQGANVVMEHGSPGGGKCYHPGGGLDCRAGRKATGWAGLSFFWSPTYQEARYVLGVAFPCGTDYFELHMVLETWLHFALRF